jgi:hypothetical protein
MKRLSHLVIVERVVYGDVPLHGDGDGHEDGGRHGDGLTREQEVGKEEDVDGGGQVETFAETLKD